MDIRGLILINSARTRGAEEFAFPEAPQALLDIAGQTPLQRAVERLRHFGVSQVSAVVEGKAVPEILENKTGMQCIVATRQRLWRVAENAFNEMAQEGAELVLVIRLGAYAEIDFERLVQFHLESACRVSQLRGGAANLDVFCISASRRNDAASLFRSQLMRCRSECPCLEHRGYVNPLVTAADLRQFAIDILTLKTVTRPAGEEARPGVWIAPGAVIEKGARLLAPAFIGRQAKVRFGAVITRCSSIEHHAEIDCGTVVENSTVLPFSYVGAGLDLAHSVVGMGRVANLRRNAAVRIRDGKLVGHIAATSSRKLLSGAARVITFLPQKIWQGVSGRNKVPRPELAAALRHTVPARSEAARLPAPGDAKAADEFAGNLAVARRYGNQ
jgi:NDP-sugar pyrophosphorylase family protein